MNDNYAATSRGDFHRDFWLWAFPVYKMQCYIYIATTNDKALVPRMLKTSGVNGNAFVPDDQKGVRGVLSCL